METKYKKLLYEEKRLLTLYRYMLRKEYDTGNRYVYENSIELKNHVEMQKAIYLAYQLLWTDESGFVWDKYGPTSPNLEANLNILDKKNNQILSYYEDFDDNIYSLKSTKNLGEFYETYKIKTLEKFTKLTKDILETNKGIELLADLAFIVDKGLPGVNFSVANQELQKARPVFNNINLNKYAYRCLETFDLIRPTQSNGKVKRIKKD